MLFVDIVMLDGNPAILSKYMLAINKCKCCRQGLQSVEMGWQWHCVIQGQYPDSSVTTLEMPTLAETIYISVLQFKSAQYFHTGRYYCDYIRSDNTISTSTAENFAYQPMGGFFGFGEVNSPTMSQEKPRGSSIKVFVSGKLGCLSCQQINVFLRCT